MTKLEAILTESCTECRLPVYYYENEYKPQSIRDQTLDYGLCFWCSFNALSPLGLEPDPLANGYYLYPIEQECSLNGETFDV